MSIKLFFEAIIKFLMGVLLLALLIFLPAGSLAYVQGWLLMGVLFVPMFAAGIVMMCKDPALLAKRLDAKEKQRDQNIVVKTSGLMFVTGFVLSGLGYRFQWYQVPMEVSIGAMVLFLLAYVLYAEVLRENAYLSRTIKVQEGQKVVDTGLYAVVRHPMYSATLILFLAMPLVLGSLYALVVFCAYPIIIGFRIRGEEKLLESELDGYSEYKAKVKYRLVPFVW